MDDNGNTRTGRWLASQFSYDGYDRLLAKSDTTVSYGYNAFGQRTSKIYSSALDNYFQYGQDGELLYEQQEGGAGKCYVYLCGLSN